ncbi:amidohydrolase family protein [Fulvimarina sp. 2208YS6-2-32]|uniref:Amidohydrolase family protein n=1 Tax=Fulvimarina uroteuthidis TaxID=3098149 RepID=A0ABU5I439_9HYPH|nr:amidohydrolase family protein [Fulvimarina sp. 2208YS6-2-32]MDY8108936.1 amidohydrolase family protein [Fulvimarina sp. 2208YS6-2-32]
MTIDRPYTGPKPSIVLPKGAIDTQTHMFLPGYPAIEPGPPLPEGLPGPDDYRKVMDWLGIERVVITQGNAHQRDNENLLACLAAMGDCARGVAVIDGATSNAALQRLDDGGITGVRIMDLPGGAVGMDGLEAVDARAHAMGWVVAVQLNGNHILDHMTALSQLKSPFIIDHHGKFFAGIAPDSLEIAAVKSLIDRGNCWFKFAGCYESSRTGGPDYTDIAAVSRDLVAFAPERIVWGTNWPHNLAKATQDYPDDAALLDTVLGWIESEADRRTILVDNPEALFGFSRRPSAA